MPVNAADRKSIRRLEKAAKLADAQRRQVITSVMSTSFGREWIWDLLSRCHCFSTTYTGDALSGAFAEGQRAIGLSLLADIMTACPDQYLQAQRESNDRNATDERRSGPESDGRDPGSVDTDPNDDDDLDDSGYSLNDRSASGNG